MWSKYKEKLPDEKNIFTVHLTEFQKLTDTLDENDLLDAEYQTGKKEFIEARNPKEKLTDEYNDLNRVRSLIFYLFTVSEFLCNNILLSDIM